MSNNQKANIRESLVEKEFFPGQVMITEGKPNNCAYIIIEGEAKMEKSQKPPEQNEETKLSTKGLRKKTIKLKALKLGMKTGGQWVGEDCLLISHGEPFPFSVIAMTKVVALQMQKQDIMCLLNPEFVKGLILQSRTKAQWLMERKQSLKKTSGKIDHMESQILSTEED